MPRRSQKETEEFTDLETTPSTENEAMSESYLSIGLGLLVVIVVGMLLFNFITRKNQQSGNGGTDETSEEGQEAGENKEGNYTVQEGDTLWSIAENQYQDGFQWKQIADANNIANPENLEKGQELKIPGKSETLPETGISGDEEVVTTQAYMVKTGDTLWSVACDVYNDCYRWSEIAQANGLSNPGVIHVGNELQIPQQ